MYVTVITLHVEVQGSFFIFKTSCDWTVNVWCLVFAVEYMFPLRKENAPFAHPYES